MISQTAEYALRAVVCLAMDEAKPLVTQQIAAITRVPTGYLSKVLQSLGRAGLVTSQRGIHGGFTLSRPAAQMTILEVVNAVDPIRRILECPLGLKTHGTRLCPLHRRLDDALLHIERSFAQTTVGDLVAEASPSKPLCEPPGAAVVPLTVGGRPHDASQPR